MTEYFAENVENFVENFCVALCFAKDIVTDPMDATKEAMTFKQSVYFLFLTSLPAALLQFVAAYLRWTTIFDNFLFANILFGIPMVVIPLYTATIIGCAMVLAALVQIAGKALRLLEFGFERTFAAAAYAMVPVATFGWAFFVFTLQLTLFSEMLMLTIRVGFVIWTLGLTVIGLMNQHKTTLLKAVLSVGVPIVAIIIAAVVIGGNSYLYLSGAAKTEKRIEIFGVVCEAGSKHSISVANVGTMWISPSEVKVYVDESGTSCRWLDELGKPMTEGGIIQPGKRATCETAMSTSVGTHKVKIMGPSNYDERFSYC